IEASPAPTTIGATRARRRTAVAATIGLVVGGTLVAAGWWATSPAPTAPAPPVRFLLTPPAAQPLLLQGNDRDIVISPDRSFVIYRSGDRGSVRSEALAGALQVPRLMIQSLNELSPRPLPGTSNARNPFLSPDGRWVGFFVGSELQKVAVAGGSPVVIAKLQGAPRGASWGDDDFIVFASSDGAGLQRVSANGGEARALTRPDQQKRELHHYPHVLPGSKAVLFNSYYAGDYASMRVDAVDVANGGRKTLLQGGGDAQYASGFLIYATVNAALDAQVRTRTSLRAMRFDVTRVAVLGDSVSVVEPVAIGTTGAANYSVSPGGDLAFVPEGGTAATARRQLVWVDRTGRETVIGAPPRSYAVARIAPDGRRVVLDTRDQANDIWIWDIDRQTLTSLNRDPAGDMSPLWTPDGKRVIWTSTRGGGNPNLYWQAADGAGAAERLTENVSNQFPTAISHDGKTVVVFGAGTGSAPDLYTLNVDEPGRPQKPLMSTPASEAGAEISPDGRWLAYHSNESGEPQVYVRPFPNVQDGRFQISTTGGTRAAWARNGRELFYLDKDGLLTVVAIQPAPPGNFSAGAPTKILNTRYYLGASSLGLDLRAYDVAPDGQRFLMIKDDAERNEPAQLRSMVVVLDFLQELKARLPAR
ncbi:MAG TPA: hypothetical protein VF491_08770, partial [Vicinamibacterales bacterium]